MSDEELQFDPDEIGPWSEIKLEVIRKYASAYSRILSAQGYFRHHYVDAFSGAGLHLSKEGRRPIEGSPIIALRTRPPFRGYHFIDMNSAKIQHLRQKAGDHPDARYYEGDCNDILLKQVFPQLLRDRYMRCLCILDPYGLQLDWQILQTAGLSGRIEIFLNFPIMDMNRNVFRKNQDSVSAANVERMNRFWGDESWRSIAYNVQQDLFGPVSEKTDNETIAEGFRQRLKNVAGFQYVADPLPMKNSRGAVVYYVLFASPNATGAKIVSEIFDRYRD